MSLFYILEKKLVVALFWKQKVTAYHWLLDSPILIMNQQKQPTGSKLFEEMIKNEKPYKLFRSHNSKRSITSIAFFCEPQ